MNKLDNRRDSARIQIQQKVKYGPGEDASTETDAFAVNLSASGIALKSYKAVTPGTTISLVLFSGDKPIRLHGEVIWNTDNEIGNNVEMGIRIISKRDMLTRLYKEKFQKTY